MSSTSSSDDESDTLELAGAPCVEPSAKRVRLRTKNMAPSTYNGMLAKKLGLKTETFQRLLLMRWPCFMFNMLWMCCEHAGPPREDLWCIEYMSGVGRIASHFTEQGLLAATYDNSDEPLFQQDILKPEGFATALRLTSRLKCKAFAHWGTVCSILGLDEPVSKWAGRRQHLWRHLKGKGPRGQHHGGPDDRASHVYRSAWRAVVFWSNPRAH